MLTAGMLQLLQVGLELLLHEYKISAMKWLVLRYVLGLPGADENCMSECIRSWTDSNGNGVRRDRPAEDGIEIGARNESIRSHIAVYDTLRKVGVRSTTASLVLPEYGDDQIRTLRA